MNRTERLLGSATIGTSRIIEIGAGYSPLAPKAAGWNTHVVDHATAEALREKYRDAEVDVGLIEEVDSIWQGGDLHDAIPASLHGSFDLLLASHLIEHIPDLVRFMASAARLLNAGGVVSLAIPDRRRCFDFFKPPTLTGDILEAYKQSRTRHSLRTAWNERAYAVTLNGLLGWSDDATGLPTLMNSFETVATKSMRFRDDPDLPYEDFHCWYFTPASFSLVMLELAEIRLLDWHVTDMHAPSSFEFFARLRRGGRLSAGGEKLQARRADLLRQILIEQREQIDLAIPIASPAPAQQEDAGVGDQLESL